MTIATLFSDTFLLSCLDNYCWENFLWVKTSQQFPCGILWFYVLWKSCVMYCKTRHTVLNEYESPVVSSAGFFIQTNIASAYFLLWKNIRLFMNSAELYQLDIFQLFLFLIGQIPANSLSPFFTTWPFVIKVTSRNVGIFSLRRFKYSSSFILPVKFTISRV